MLSSTISSTRKRRAGLARQRLLDLDLSPFPRHQWNTVVELYVGDIGVLQVLRIALARVLGDKLFCVFLAGFEKVRGLNERHRQPPHCVSIRREITFRRRRADVGKIESFLKIRRADQDAMGHPLGQMYGSRRRRKPHDSSGPKRRRPLGRTAHLNDRHVLDWLQTESFNQDPSGHVRCAPDPADADTFPPEIFRRS